MSDKSIQTICFMTGFFIAVIFVLVWRYFIVKRQGTQCQYDERQVLARGFAYRSSFATAIIYMLFCAMVDMLEFRWAEVHIQMLLGMILSMTVFIVVCIFKDAYFNLSNRRPASFLILCLFMAAVQAFVFVEAILSGNSIIKDGVLGNIVINVGLVLFFVAAAAALVIKIIIEKRTVEE